MANKMDWVQLWKDDREAIYETMKQNMIADLQAGYNPAGHCIRKQIVDIEEFQMRTERCLLNLKQMTDTEAKRWCYFELKKHGAI